MNVQIILALCAAVIICGLAFYAGMLLKRIKLQQLKIKIIETEKIQQLAEKKQQRNENISESIRFIARATAQKQCEIAEATIRLVVLLETLVVEPRIDIEKEYPGLSMMFAKIKDFPTHEARKDIPVKELKKQNMQRQVLESEYEQVIIKEAQRLVNFTL